MDAQGHEHGIAHDADRRRLGIALALIVGFMAVEVVAGILAHSLALLSDAAHMLTDAGAIGLSLLAIMLAARPPSGSMTFGLKRAEILSAQANGAILVVLAGLIVYEAIRRLVSPPDVEGWVVVAVAVAGIAVNLLATWQLAKANRENMAVEGSFQHMLTDLYAFAGTAIAGVIIVTTGYVRADPIASIAVAALMLRAAYGLLKDSGRVLLEMAPERMSAPEIGQELAAHPAVAEVHDLHVWEIGTDMPSLSAHVLVGRGIDCHGVRLELEQLLHDRFGIDHTTLQVDHVRERRLVELRKLSDNGR
ncbi:MAG TPA: cation diffusion facilitator family transporter [Gaiellaceae bacterium]